MVHRCIGFLTASFLALTATDSFAQSAQDQPGNVLTNGSKADDTKLAKLKAEAEAFVQADDCERASAPLRAAWALKQEASTAVALGECELKLRKEPEGAHHLAQALDLLPNGPERTRVDAVFREIASRLARLDVAVSEDNAIVVVDKIVTETPVKDLFVHPGNIWVTVKKTGFVEDRRYVTAKAGQTVRVVFTLEKVTTGPRFSSLPSPSVSSPIPIYIGIGAGIVSLSLGVGLRVAGTNRSDDADEILENLRGSSACCGNENPEDCAEIKKLRLASDDFVNASTGLFVASGVLLGGTMLYGYLSSGRTSSDVAIVPFVSLVNSGVLIQGRF